MDTFLAWFNKYEGIITSVVILVVGYALINISARYIRRLIKKVNKDTTAKLFLLSVSKVIVYILLLISVASKLGMPVTSFLTMVGAVSLAFSLAAKDSLSNLASGFMLMFSKPFAAGDFIESENVTGTVLEVGFLYTIITTSDNKKTYLPNAAVANNKILNYSACDKRRVEVEIPINYKEDINKVKRAIFEVLDANLFIYRDPMPIVNIIDFGDSSQKLTVRFWSPTEKYYDVFLEIREQIKDKFDKEGIVIPCKVFELVNKE